MKTTATATVPTVLTADGRKAFDTLGRSNVNKRGPKIKN